MLSVFLLMTAPAAAQNGVAAIVGQVRDQSGGVLPGATVVVRTISGQFVTHTSTDAVGAYSVVNLPAGDYVVDVSMPSFATTRSNALALKAGESRHLQAVLRLTITADVIVTGKRTFRNLADLETFDGSLIGVADAASEGVVTGRQIEARPIPLSHRATFVVDGFNLLDTKVSDIDYFYTLRLPGEPAAGVDDVHRHPAPPRTLRIGIRTGF